MFLGLVFGLYLYIYTLHYVYEFRPRLTFLSRSKPPPPFIITFGKLFFFYLLLFYLINFFFFCIFFFNHAKPDARLVYIIFISSVHFFPLSPVHFRLRYDWQLASVPVLQYTLRLCYKKLTTPLSF